MKITKRPHSSSSMRPCNQDDIDDVINAVDLIVGTRLGSRVRVSITTLDVIKVVIDGNTFPSRVDEYAVPTTWSPAETAAYIACRHVYNAKEVQLHLHSFSVSKIKFSMVFV